MIRPSISAGGMTDQLGIWKGNQTIELLEVTLFRINSMRSAREVVAGVCALMAMGAGGCGGGGGGSGSGSPSPPPSSNVTVKISPTSATIGFKGTKQFTATVSGATNTAVTWSVTDSSGGTGQVGTISSSGLYTAPAATSVGPPGAGQTVSVTAGHTATSVNVSVPQLNPVDSVTVTAASQADTSKSASATVTLSGLSILDVGQCPVGGGTCTARVTGTQVARGQTAILFIVGYGIVPGTTYAISGNDIVVQPTSLDFTTTTDGTPAVTFSIVVSAGATLGPRNIVVTNSGGELSAFPGGLQITQ
jgi:hypothetical protein